MVVFISSRVARIRPPGVRFLRFPQILHDKKSIRKSNKTRGEWEHYFEKRAQRVENAPENGISRCQCIITHLIQLNCHKRVEIERGRTLWKTLRHMPDWNSSLTAWTSSGNAFRVLRKNSNKIICDRIVIALLCVLSSTSSAGGFEEVRTNHKVLRQVKVTSTTY